MMTEAMTMMMAVAMAMAIPWGDRRKIHRRNAKLQLTCMTIKIKLYTPSERALEPGAGEAKQLATKAQK